MNAINITGSETTQKGTVKLYENPFGNGQKYYGKVERNTVDSRTLLTKIQKKNAGTSLHAIQEAMGLLKEVVLDSLAEGEAVNLLDLLTIYIGVDGKIEGQAIQTKEGKTPFTVKITPTELLKDAVSKIAVKNIELADTNPKIASVFDRFTQTENSTVSIGKEVRLTGERLKLSGEESAVYLCPLNEKNDIKEDESTWIKCSNLTCNTLSKIEFYVPEETEPAEYRVVVRSYSTANGQTGRSRKQAVSEIINAVKN